MNKSSIALLSPAPRWWRMSLIISLALLLLGIAVWVYVLMTGIGVWGNQHPVGWAWDVTGFVFWIGIGHAGTLISAVFFLLRQQWRTSIHCVAEAMTLCAVLCASLYPILHLGRAWMAWFLIPVPNAQALWPNFRSPLLWDAFAIATYFLVSLCFWYLGLIPQLATVRDQMQRSSSKILYGFFALGWCGSQRQWQHYEKAYGLFAGLATPLVLSVHSIVSCDFATSLLPGWHTTLFPPYFVVGAIFGGLAFLLTLILPIAAWEPQFKSLITSPQVEKICKIMLLMSGLLGYAYGMELFMAWYGGHPDEQAAFYLRATAPGSREFYGLMLLCNVLMPQLFWFRFFRTQWGWVWTLCQFPNVGMWYERFVIIATTLQQDFLPSSWRVFHPTAIDILTFVGSFGLFLTLFLLFIRFFPVNASFGSGKVSGAGDDL